MAKAASRFKTVLNVKKHQEKAVQQQLIQIQDAHLKEKEALENLHEAREGVVNDTPRFGKARATDLQTQRAFIFKLTRQINHQTSKVDEVKAREHAKRHELTERSQSRQMVEKLVEKRKAEAARLLDRKEQEIIDEMANRPNKVS